MKDLSGLLKQAQEMQANLKRAQDELADLEVTGEAAGGMVTITLNGKGEARKVRIEPSFLVPSEVEVLEDLIAAALNDARKKQEAVAKDKMASVTGPLSGMLPPGMNLPI